MTLLRAQDHFIQMERSFAEAVLLHDGPIPASIALQSGTAAASRFKVYRNNVLSGLIGALAIRYPASRRLLWEDTFERAARLYLITHPPRSPVLSEFGENFPDFLFHIGQRASIEGVSDVARLESARLKAYHAADATPIAANIIAALPQATLSATRFALHPSLSLVQSRFPVVSLWQSAETGKDLTQWKGEAALVVRPDMDVDVWRLPPGGYEFIATIKEDGCLADAAAAAIAAYPASDLPRIFEVLLRSNAVVEVLSPL